jgi:hypothetical protein
VLAVGANAPVVTGSQPENSGLLICPVRPSSQVAPKSRSTGVPSPDNQVEIRQTHHLGLV